MGSQDLSSNEAYDFEGRVNWERMALIWQAKYFEALNELHKANKALARRRRYKQRQRYVDVLEAETGVTTAEWVDVLESTMAKHSVPADDAPQRTHIYAVYAELLDIMRASVRRHTSDHPKPFDMNISVARAIGCVLTAWATAVVEAKAFDPKRSVEDRKEMLRYSALRRKAVARAVLHQPQLREPWKGQEWENPFDRFGKGPKK